MPGGDKPFVGFRLEGEEKDLDEELGLKEGGGAGSGCGGGGGEGGTASGMRRRAEVGGMDPDAMAVLRKAGLQG